MTEMGLAITRDASGKYVASDPDADLSAYMAIDDTYISKVNGYGEKLVIVGTVKDGQTNRNIVEGGTYPKTDIKINGSGAYDLTTPCPNVCDEGSSIFHLPL